jgi:cell division protein FtsL
VQAERGLLLGALGALNGLSRNPSLDRLIRGRTWIVLIAFALIGIVTLQLLVLRLNANIGRALVREAQLQRANAALSIESSELAAGERVESLTSKLGMELVPEGALRFLSINPRADIARAAAALNKPVQTASTSSGEATDTSASASSGEASAATPTTGEAGTGASTSVAGSATGQNGEASTAPSATGAAATSESPSTNAPTPTATQPTSAEAGTTGAVGATGAAEAAPGASASGTQASGAG